MYCISKAKNVKTNLDINRVLMLVMMAVISSSSIFIFIFIFYFFCTDWEYKGESYEKLTANLPGHV